MPENPFLLVMSADTAAKQRDLDLAATSARDALRYLEHAEPPSHFSPQHGRSVRDELRATALFVQGRVAAVRGQYKEAEQSLLASLTLNPDDMEALYTIGVVRMAVRADEGAARAFAHVAQADGPLASAARESLRVLHARSAGDAGTSFDAWRAALKWNPPEAPVPVTRTREPGRYAGSQACRECHARVYTTLAVDGHGANVQSLSARRRDRRLLRHADRVGSCARGDGRRRATSSRFAAATTTSGFATRSTT